MSVNLADFTRSITQGPSGIMPARLENVRYEEQLKRYESGRELSLIMKQAHDGISLAENNKHVGQAATELAKSIASA